jgi:Mor family transcriptional regulator
LKYKNAKNMLPAWLVERLQDYVQGEIIYIPKKQKLRVGWGASNGTREKYLERNTEIMMLYRNGTAISDLSLKYCLSEDSIRKIVSGMREMICQGEVTINEVVQ